MVSRSKTPNEICKMITFENNNFQAMNVVGDWPMNHICSHFVPILRTSSNSIQNNDNTRVFPILYWILLME